MTITHGTVTIEATQLATDLRAVIKDKCGISKSVVFAEDKVERIPWRLIADNHIRYPQAKTGRN